MMPLEEIGKTTTSIVQTLSPELTIISLKSQAEELLTYAENRVIIIDDDVKSATDDLSIIAKAKKVLEDKRKEYVKPLNDQVKIINNTFMLVSGPLLQADAITRQKILAYRKEQEQKKIEVEKLNREGKVVGKLIEILPEQPSHIDATFGTADKMMIRKWEVEDFAKVPDEYKLIDSARVNKLVKAGIPSIPGIRIFKEETLRVTAK